MFWSTLHGVGYPVDYNGEFSRILLTVGILAILLFLFYAPNTTFAPVDAPCVGHYHRWEPRYLVGLRYLFQAQSMVAEGWNRYKDRPFRLHRNDTDLLVVPGKYVEELRQLPETQLSADEAHMKNLSGDYTAARISYKSHFHIKAIHRMLSPHLPDFTEEMRDETNEVLKSEFPECSGQWVEVDIYAVLIRLVGRVSARIFVGEELCRDPEWLRVAYAATENVFASFVLLRMLPRPLQFLKPIYARCLPFYWRLRENLRTATKLVPPYLTPLQEPSTISDVDKVPRMLRAMHEMASNDTERDPKHIAQRELLMSIATVHSVAIAIVNMLYDLCANPLYWEFIRGEMQELGFDKEDGWLDHPELDGMPKLESLMSESMRMNPPSLFATHRIAMQDLPMSDGFVIPCGTHVVFPAAQATYDAGIVTDPGIFDPWRSLRQRTIGGEEEKHGFMANDNLHLHFGRGKRMCPGRPFATHLMKLILIELLNRYDMRFKDGQSRPKNVTFEEFCFPWPGHKILVRERSH